MPFELLDAETLYAGKIFSVQRHRLRYPDGREVAFEIIQHGGAVTMVPVDGEGQVIFVRQYRHAAGEALLELPAGRLEEGEPPEECARRELREEIGMAAGKMKKLGEFFLAPGYSSEHMQVYLATELRPDPLQPDADEQIEIERYPLAEAYALLAGGKLRDAKTVAALALAGSHFK